MSKTASKKKLIFKDIIDRNAEENSNTIIKSSSRYNSIDKNSENGIIEVYEHNFIQEIKKICELSEDYNYIGMDTEFPGIVFSENFYYKTLKKNVDKLKLIQLGITLTNEKGEYPKNYPYHTWQFNLKFDENIELYKDDSIKLLKECGINFDKLRTNGINTNLFAEYLTISNLVLNPNIHWVSFQGSYDFGYLLRLLINRELPEDEDEFINLLNVFFVDYYDIRMLVKGNNNSQIGLNKLAAKLEVKREGQIHQAGSDSLVTIDVFFKLKKLGLVDNKKLEEYKNILYGIGKGQDNEETFTYTPIGGMNSNMNYQNSNINNILYLNQLNSKYMNVYNYPMIINNQNNLLLNKNNSGQMQTVI